MKILNKEKRKAVGILQDVLHSKHSDFYREKYKNSTSVVQKIEDDGEGWELLPFLTRDEIQTTPFYKRLFVPRKELNIIRPTSGTSGKGVLLIPKTEQEPNQYIQPLHATYFKEKDIKRAVTFSGAHSFYSNILKNKFNLNSVYLDPGNLEVSAHIFKVYKPDVLLGFPYAISSILPLLSSKDRESIQVIILFGEWCSHLQRRLIQKHFKDAVIISEYSNIEAQVSIAEPCYEILKSGECYFHTFQDFVFAEVINPSTGLVINNEGVSGELVITTISPVALPLIRYRTGDSATIIRSHCKCGLQTPVISIDGRIEVDRLRLPGGELNIQEIDRVFLQYDKYITGNDFYVRYSEVLLKNNVMRPKVTMYFSWDRDKTNISTLTDMIAHSLRVAPEYTYADGVKSGKYEPLDVQFLSPQVNISEKKKIRIVRDSE